MPASTPKKALAPSAANSLATVAVRKAALSAVKPTPLTHRTKTLAVGSLHCPVLRNGALN